MISREINTSTNRWAMGMLVFQAKNYQFFDINPRLYVCYRYQHILLVWHQIHVQEQRSADHDRDSANSHRSKVSYLTKTIFFLIRSSFLCASRFNVELDKETSTFILRIRDIQETDGATYQCQVLFLDWPGGKNLPKNCLALVQPTSARVWSRLESWSRDVRARSDPSM